MDFNLDFEFLMLMATTVFTLANIKKRRRFKIRPMNRRRQENSVYKNIVEFAKKSDHEQFFKYTRMSPEMFDHLLNLLEPYLKRDVTKNPICPGQRLALTLHYLSEGCSMQEIAWNNYIGKSTAHYIIKETCQVLWTVLVPLVLKPPSVQELKNIAEQNFKRWNVPNCIGSVDGKHVEIQCPNYSGSTFFSYKKSFSMILMAVCDSYYKFTYVDIGAAGGNHDSAVFKSSSYGQAIINGSLPIPQSTPLPGTDILFPYFFAADQAFPLHTNIMRPFPGSFLDERKNIFNMRISRVRRTIENTFGILAQRWRRLRSTIIADEEMCRLIIQATVVLHNFIQKSEEDFPIHERKYCPTGFVDWEDENGILHKGNWREDGQLRSVGRISANNAARTVQKLRECLADYFLSAEGAVYYQWNKINAGGVSDRP